MTIARTFICEPIHGLGNRLLMLASVSRLAVKFNASLKVAWKLDINIQASFEEMFGSVFELISEMPDEQAPYKFNFEKEARAIFRDNREPIVYFRGWTHAILLPEDLDRGRINQLTFEIATEIFALLKYFLSHIRPELTGLKLPNTLGIHIRRNTDVEQAFAQRLEVRDYENSINPHPELSNWNTTSMEEIVRLCIEAVRVVSCNAVYISSPDVALRDRLGWEFARLGIKSSVSSSRQFGADRNSLVEALSDLFILSRCSYILRSGKTTFSAVSSLIGTRKELIFDSSGRIRPSVATILGGNAL